MQCALVEAKEKAVRRTGIEHNITRPMLYVKGWPIRMLTDGEADVLAEARTAVSDLLGFRSSYLDRKSIRASYAELMETKSRRAKPA